MRRALVFLVFGSLTLLLGACGDELDSAGEQSMPVGYGQACAASGDCISDLCHPVSLRCTIACVSSAECGTGAACEGGLCVFGVNSGGGNNGGGNAGGGNNGGGNTGGGNTGGGMAPAQSVDVYSIKAGSLLDDTPVTVGGIVTATRINAEGQYSHLVLQVPSSDPSFRGTENSGLWVYLNNADDESLKTNPPLPGSLVTITGQVNNFYDQWQIQHVESYSVQGMATLPTPTIVSSAEVATGGARAMALEGTLVTVENVEVSEIEPPAGPGDGMEGEATYEFVVDGQLRVNDYFYRLEPLPNVGTRYSAITGILRWGNAHSKLEPRSQNDYR